MWGAVSYIGPHSKGYGCWGFEHTLQLLWSSFCLALFWENKKLTSDFDIGKWLFSGVPSLRLRHFLLILNSVVCLSFRVSSNFLISDSSSWQSSGSVAECPETSITKQNEINDVLLIV